MIRDLARLVLELAAVAAFVGAVTMYAIAAAPALPV